MQRIFYFDHSELLYNDVEPVISDAINKLEGEYTYDSRYIDDDTVAIDTLKELKSWDVVIAHMNPMKFIELIKGTYSENPLIRICISSQGLYDYSNFIHKSNICCVYLNKKHQTLEKNNWGDILKIATNSEVAFGIAKGEVPHKLRPFFGKGKEAEVLLSIAILAQGFLLSCASHEKIKPDDLEKDDDPIKKAIKKMGCDKFIIDDLFKHAGGKYSDAKKKQYWHIFNSSIKNAIKNEVKELNIKSNDLGNVFELVEVLNKGDLDSKQDAELVALAYLDIYNVQIGKAAR